MTPYNREIFGTLLEAIENNDLFQFQQIFETSISGKEDVINDIGGGFASLLLAAGRKGNSDIILNELVTRLPSMVPALLASNDYFIFELTCRSGNLSMVNRLIELIGPELLQTMLSQPTNNFFASAAASGNLQLLERIIGLAPDKVQQMIAANDYSAYRQAAEKGNMDILLRIEELAPDKIADMVEAERYGFNAYNMAASSGRLAVLEHIEHLEQIPPSVIQKMRRDDYYAAFNYAAFHGHVEIVAHLISTTSPIDTQEMIFIYIGSHLTQNIQENYDENAALVLEQIMRVASDENREAIFQKFIDSGTIVPEHSHIRQYLHRLRPELITVELVSTELIHDAIWEGNIDKIRQIALTNPEQFYAYIQADDYEFFKMAALRCRLSQSHLDVASFILQNTPVEERQLMIAAFINSPLPQIIVEHHDDNTRRLLNHIVQLSSEANQDQIWAEFVTTSQNLYPGPILSRVQALARNLFPDRSLAVMSAAPTTAFGLEATARNPESSMQSLNPSEEKRLAAAFVYYQEPLQTLGSKTIIDNFKQDLRRRYEEDPAKVRTGDGREIVLPFEWRDAVLLMQSLSAETREAALKAYHQNQIHTAYRYFLKPNPWMDKYASFVNRDASNNGWSTFENHQDLIALLIVAANDERIPEIDGFNQESRVTELIREIALVNRAHNWDKTRINPITGKSEEYDDLESDRPSCTPGVKSRLFQAVKKHPLLELLTPEMINAEIYPIIKAHFEEQINTENCKELNQAWQQVIEGEAPPSILQSLNIPEARLQSLIESIATTLRDKYGSQFDDDPSLLEHLTQAMKITSPFNSHAEKFGGSINLAEMLEAKVKSLPPSKEAIRLARLSYFQQNPEPKEQNTPEPKGGNVRT